MALEAQEVTVGVRLLGGAAFERDANKVAGSIRGIGDAGRKTTGLLGTLNKAGTVMRSVGSKMVAFGSSVRNVGRGLMTLSVPIAYIGYQGVKAALNFNQQMTLLQTQANASGATVRQLTKDVLGLSATYGDPANLATGLYPIVSSGLKGADAMNALKAAAMGARVGIDSVQNTSTALMAVMNTGLKDIRPGNFKGAMGIIDAIVGQGMLRLPQLLDALHSEILPMAKESGLGLKDIGAAMAVMTRQGIPAQRFANLMKLTLTKLLAPKGEALKALQTIGLTQFQLADDMRKPHGLLTALADLRNHLKILGRDQQFAVLAAAFGQSRGISNILGILNVVPRMQQVLKLLDQKGNARTFQQHFQQTINSPSGKWQTLLNQIKKSLTVLGLALLPTLIPLLSEVTRVVTVMTNWFNKLPPGVKSTIIKFAALLLVLGPIIFGIGTLITTVGSAVAVLGGVVAVAPEVGGALLGLMGPIGLLAGAFVLAYEKITPFRNAVDTVTNWVAGLFTHHHKKKHIMLQGVPSNDPSAIWTGHGWADVRKPGSVLHDPSAVWTGHGWADIRKPKDDPNAVWTGHGWADVRFPSPGHLGDFAVTTNVNLDGKTIVTQTDRYRRDKAARR